jgi:hypothetical protein
LTCQTAPEKNSGDHGRRGDQAAIEVPALAGLLSRLRGSAMLLRLPTVARFADEPAALLHDADGHAVRLVEEAT